MTATIKESEATRTPWVHDPFDPEETYGVGWDMLTWDVWQHLEADIALTQGDPQHDRLCALAEELQTSKSKALTKIEAHSTFQRLKGLRVHGYKSTYAVPGHVLPITRFPHSRGVGARHGFYQLVLKSRGDTFTLRQAEEALQAAWRGIVVGLAHDPGHYAGGHDADRAVSGRPGRANHEWQSVFRLAQDLSLIQWLEEAGVPFRWLMETVHEMGPDGMLQKLADTDKYAPWDAELTGIDYDPELPRRMICALERVSKDNRYVVASEEPFLKLLDLRAVMFRDFYQSFNGLLNRAAVQLVYNYAIQEGFLRPEDLERGTDIRINDDKDAFVLDEWFEELYHNPGKHPAWFDSCLRLIRGDKGELDRWEDMYPDNPEHRQFLLQVAAGQYVPKSSYKRAHLYIPKAVTNSKALPVVCAGKEKQLRSKVGRTDRNRVFIFRFKG